MHVIAGNRAISISNAKSNQGHWPLIKEIHILVGRGWRGVGGGLEAGRGGWMWVGGGCWRGGSYFLRFRGGTGGGRDWRGGLEGRIMRRGHDMRLSHDCIVASHDCRMIVCVAPLRGGAVHA